MHDEQLFFGLMEGHAELVEARPGIVLTGYLARVLNNTLRQAQGDRIPV